MTQQELSIAEEILKERFGREWKQIVQTLGTKELTSCIGRDFTSFLAFPARDEGGDNRWRGNCAPQVVEKVLAYALENKRFEGKDSKNFLLLDPMSGSGSSMAAARKLNVEARLYDLNPSPPEGRGNWNALLDEVDISADCIFLHPPYHQIIKYSGNMWGSAHPDDLSRCGSYKEFIEKLNFVIEKLFMSLRHGGHLAILVGDIRSKNVFHSIQTDMIHIGKQISHIIKAQFHCASEKKMYGSQRPLIPIVTEHLLIFQKDHIIQIPYSIRKEGIFDVGKDDCRALTWLHLIRMALETAGGTLSLSDLYHYLENHPKAKKNKNYQSRIRATIYEHKENFLTDGKGTYRLSYANRI